MTSSQDATALRATIARLAASGELSQRQIARRIKKPPATVRYHLSRLLDTDVLRIDAGGGQGTFTIYKPGGRWALFEQALRGGQESDRRARSRPAVVMDLHRGARSWPVVQSPKVIDKVPGLVGPPTVLSGVPNYVFRHSDESGREWSFQFFLGKTKRTMVVNPPSVLTTDPQLVESVEAQGSWWDDWVEKEARRWSNLAGFALAHGPPNRSHAVKTGIPGTPFASTGTTQDPVSIDSSPEPGTIQASPEVIAELARLPDTVAILMDRLTAVEERQGQQAVLAERMVSVAERQAGITEKLEQAQVAVLASLSPLPSKQPSLSLSPDSGVDVS